MCRIRSDISTRGRPPDFAHLDLKCSQPESPIPGTGECRRPSARHSAASLGAWRIEHTHRWSTGASRTHVSLCREFPDLGLPLRAFAVNLKRCRLGGNAARVVIISLRFDCPESTAQSSPRAERPPGPLRSWLAALARSIYDDWDLANSRPPLALLTQTVVRVCGNASAGVGKRQLEARRGGRDQGPGAEGRWGSQTTASSAHVAVLGRAQYKVGRTDSNSKRRSISP
jgi:hypothetical protein